MNKTMLGLLVGALALSGCIDEGMLDQEGVLDDEGAVSGDQQELRTIGRPSGTLCVAFDLPDDDFIDSNCDGIDGDVGNAIFVSPSGDDSNPGTQALPMQTMQEAVRKAWGEGKDVYVAGGIYVLDEALAVLDGVSIYGGYASDWSRSAGIVGRAILFRPGMGSDGPEELYAMTGLNVREHATVVDRLLVQVGSNGGGSSIGIFVFESPLLSLRNLDVASGFAGDGADGRQAEDGQRALPGSAGSSGFTATCGRGTIPSGTGGLSCHFACSADCNLIPTGGAGGARGAGEDGLLSQLGTSSFGRGGLGGRMNRNGSPGGNAPPMSLFVRHNPVNGLGGAPGERGATGPSGRRGGGGGGGGSGGESFWGYWGGTGGGGGGGGCGGLGGEGGAAGFSSIGLKATIAIGLVEHCVFRSARGGDGGDGGAGQLGGRGGFGGPGGGSGSGCGDGARGGRGADGESGGVGGGGGGGNSLAVLLVNRLDIPQYSFDPLAILAFDNQLIPGRGGDGGEGSSTRAPSDVGDLDGARGLEQGLLIQCNDGPC